MIFVDTGVWYAKYIIDDVDHGRAAEWFCNVSERLVTTDYILDELFTLMNVRGHGSVAIVAGELLFTGGPCELEYVQPEDVSEAWKVFPTFRNQRLEHYGLYQSCDHATVECNQGRGIR